MLAGMTALSVVLWLRTLHLHLDHRLLVCLILLTLSSYAVLEGLFALQAGLLVGFLLASSLAALIQERFVLSGILLSLTLIKPQMTVLVAAYLLLWSFTDWRARGRFAAAFLLMSCLLVGSALLVYPRWIPEWLHVISGYGHYSTPPLLCYLLGTRFGIFLIVALLFGAIVLAWRKRHAASASSEFALTVSLLLATTVVTLLPGHAVYDHVLLLPGIILIALSWRALASRPPFRLILYITAVALFWQWLLAPLVIAMHPIVSHEQFVSTLLTLPIRTAASIPFGVLALLAVLMWSEVSARRASQTL
jgi:hypothetical protein